MAANSSNERESDYLRPVTNDDSDYDTYAFKPEYS